MLKKVSKESLDKLEDLLSKNKVAAITIKQGDEIKKEVFDDVIKDNDFYIYYEELSEDSGRSLDFATSANLLKIIEEFKQMHLLNKVVSFQLHFNITTNVVVFNKTYSVKQEDVTRQTKIDAAIEGINSVISLIKDLDLNVSIKISKKKADIDSVTALQSIIKGIQTAEKEDVADVQK